MMTTAPWTDSFIKQLQTWQDNKFTHSYTCGDCRQDLVPTREGWICPDCAYTQNWSHTNTEIVNDK